MTRNLLFYTIFFFALLFDGCDDAVQASHDPNPSDSIYTARAAMLVYAKSPHRALQIIDSAEIVGNVKPFEASILRATVFTQAPDEFQQPDSAIAICRGLLEEDSLDSDEDEVTEMRIEVLSILCNAYRLKRDNEQQIRYSTELAALNRKKGFTTEALRTEAEIAVVMTRLGRTAEGLARLNDIIHQLDVAGSIDMMDACIVAIKRKICVLQEHELYANIIPMAQLILEKLAHYQEHPDGYVEDSFRLPPGDDGENHVEYCEFYRAQAYAFLAIAYSAPSADHNSKLAREYLSRFDQTAFGQSYGGRKMISSAWFNLGEYAKLLDIYDEVEQHMGTDTINREYAYMLRDRALVAQHEGRLREACDYWSRHHELMENLNDEQRVRQAQDFAARYYARENELKLEASEADSERKTIIIVGCLLLIVIGIFGTIYFGRQRRLTMKKNRSLALQISEALDYKEKYLKLAQSQQSAVQEPLPLVSPVGPVSPGESAEGSVASSGVGSAAVTQPAGDVDNQTLFHFLYKDILDKQLYLDPSFDRQAVVDRYGLNNMQVGAAFAQGSKDYNSVSDFIRACRLEHACRLLSTTDMRISEVAAASGFNRTTTFNHDFKSRYNLSPTEFRER